MRRTSDTPHQNNAVLSRNGGLRRLLGVTFMRCSLFASLVAGGCLHHPDLRTCDPSGGEAECWVSTDVGSDGDLQHVIVERVTLGDICDRIELEESWFDVSGRLVEYAVELRRCGITERRTQYKYDFERGLVATKVELDLDHDDQFEITRRDVRPMTEEHRMLVSLGQARLTEVTRDAD